MQDAKRRLTEVIAMVLISEPSLDARAGRLLPT
jgi:hypothetical protein